MHDVKKIEIFPYKIFKHCAISSMTPSQDATISSLPVLPGTLFKTLIESPCFLAYVSIDVSTYPSPAVDQKPLKSRYNILLLAFSWELTQ